MVHLSAPSPQSLPQPPQWSKFVVVFTQLPPQHVEPQVKPHPPQCAAVVATSTQAPPQQRSVPVHDGPPPHPHTPAEQLSPGAQAGSQGTSLVHVPARQASPAPQTTPQPPQFIRSVWVAMQPPPQQLWDAPQAAPAPQRQVRVATSQVSPALQAGSHGGTTQSPPSQICPASQARSHAPQFAAEVMVSAQPSVQHASPSRHFGPSLQRHCPDAHIVPVSPHIRPQAPQFRGLEGKETHEPLQQLSPLGHGESGPHVVPMQIPSTHSSPGAQLMGHSPPSTPPPSPTSSPRVSLATSLDASGGAVSGRTASVGVRVEPLAQLIDTDRTRRKRTRFSMGCESVTRNASIPPHPACGSTRIDSEAQRPVDSVDAKRFS